MAIIQTQCGTCLAERGLAGTNSMGERAHEEGKNDRYVRRAVGFEMVAWLQ